MFLASVHQYVGNASLCPSIRCETKQENATGLKSSDADVNLTSPFLTVIDCRRGVVSSLMLDRKFWEIRRASCRSGWSGWLVGVCLSKSWSTAVDVEILYDLV